MQQWGCVMSFTFPIPSSGKINGMREVVKEWWGYIGQRKVCKTRYCGHQPSTIIGASCYSKAVSTATEVMQEQQSSVSTHPEAVKCAENGKFCCPWACNVYFWELEIKKVNENL